MDQGWAVVLGAVVALTGSSLIPWARESFRDRAERKRQREVRLREAVVDVLAANAAQGSALTFDNDADLHVAFEARARAVARLLIEADSAERRGLSAALNAAAPGRSDTGERIRALQLVLTAWAGGDMSAESLESEYRKELQALKDARKHR
ncbi:hypothetical protein [Microbacterium sp. TNHR37B]|uniref:hypothetical protein n=1 Tax=Microbacterium sp. TNHR37B TaxID=1775956 RepID=UPI0007B2F44A|nr:hypothetical protein [Microbacterium sp. TNHR37B]KZE90629.1 hypothetical protein AVP41_00148 [Microbacterium sp. TNHR37B]